MAKRVTYVVVRYRLYTSIFYEQTEIDIPSDLPDDDETLDAHCYNVLRFERRLNIATHFISKKRFSKRVAKKITK